MKTHYYCDNCDIFFWEEEEIPNINRVHYKCGLRAKLLGHISEKDTEKE